MSIVSPVLLLGCCIYWVSDCAFRLLTLETHLDEVFAALDGTRRTVGAVVAARGDGDSEEWESEDEGDGEQHLVCEG